MHAARLWGNHNPPPGFGGSFTADPALLAELAQVVLHATVGEVQLTCQLSDGDLRVGAQLRQVLFTAE